MNKKINPLLLTLFFGNLFTLSVAIAQSKKPLDNSNKGGTIAQTSNSGAGTNVAIDTFGELSDPLKDDKGVPADPSQVAITGSVSNVKPGRWLVKIFNNSAAPVSGSFRFIELGKVGAKLKSTPFFKRLLPNEAYERQFSTLPVTLDARLDIVDWKMETPPPAFKNN
jgi:hypothetical protein